MIREASKTVLQDVIGVIDYSRIYLRRQSDIHDTIVIAGAPRTGTTWVYELLLTLSGYTGLFEPFGLWSKAPLSLIERARPYSYYLTHNQKA